VIRVELAALEYSKRLSLLLEHRISLWDVIANARRIGSLDSAIRDHSHNDLVTLIDTLLALNTVAFNGATAAKIRIKALDERAQQYRILHLPSSSPAHASISYDQKLEIWRHLST